MWKDQWHNRGRRPDDVCMTRIDDEGAWSQDNTMIISRKEHFQKTAASKATNGKPYIRRSSKK